MRNGRKCVKWRGGVEVEVERGNEREEENMGRGRYIGRWGRKKPRCY